MSGLFSSAVSGANDFMTNAGAGLKSSVQSQLNSRELASSSGGAVPDVLPWSNVNTKSRYFEPITIKADRWDQLFPYRLLVIDTSLEGNPIVNDSSTGATYSIKRDTTRTLIDFEKMTPKWVYVLPITPQQLTITDQYAISTTATLLGVMEEHSGVKFKQITATGTMGVWPFRQNISKPPSDNSANIVGSIFGGTIAAAGNAITGIARTINAATSGSAVPKPTISRPETSREGLSSTGYYHALTLMTFLEQYAEAKKDPKNAGWRLVFDIPKQNQSLIVTPMSFNWSQNANKPMEIDYSFQLKAWRRIDLAANPEKKPKSGVSKLSPGLLQRVLNTISEARKTLSALTALVGAVRSDVLGVLDILRQTSLFLKDAIGVVLTAADLPFQLQRDLKYAVSDFFKSLSFSELLKNAATDPAVAQALKDLKVGWSRAEGSSAGSIRAGTLGPGAIQAQKIDPGMALLDKPETAHGLMNSVNVSSLQISDAQQDAINDSIVAARQISVDDLRGYRATMSEVAQQLANNFGAGDAFFSKVYGKATPNVRIQPMTLDEYDILQTIYDVVQGFDLITATAQIDDDKKQTNMKYVAGLADGANVLFESGNVSKVLVPVPFGLTVEGIAARYLGDAQRWLEIVTLNNLRDPYIDENGFQRKLLSNASGRQITITSTEDMFVGQRIVLRSSTQQESARRILNIDRLSDTSYLLTLDGDANLGNFITTDGAYLQAYLPGTTNSQQKIYIPTALPTPNDPRIIIPTAVANEKLVGMSKVDWLLTDSGDLAVNSYGDFRYSAGMTNLIQALRIKMGTQKGKVLLHPQFGLGVKAGMMTTDLDVQDVYNSIDKLIKADPRFAGLQNLQVVLTGPTLTINMAVVLTGNEGIFPISFDIPA